MLKELVRGEFEKEGGSLHVPLTDQLLFDEFGFEYIECIQDGPYCFRKEELHLSAPPFLLKIASKAKGYGLFSLSPIALGQRIGVYAGKLHEVSLLFPQTNPYCLLYPERRGIFPLVIDAYRVGSLMRFLNHSEIPNVGVIWEVHQTESGSVHIPIIAAIREILPFEEIVISYGAKVNFPL